MQQVFVKVTLSKFTVQSWSSPHKFNLLHGLKGAVSRNSAKLGNYKMPDKLTAYNIKGTLR